MNGIVTMFIEEYIKKTHFQEGVFFLRDFLRTKNFLKISIDNKDC